jgi:hypothetical protein
MINKKVRDLITKELSDIEVGSPTHHFALMHILGEALTDANFHPESRKVPQLFRKANYELDDNEKDFIKKCQKIGRAISHICEWDGVDIVDSIGFYVSMSIGRPLGSAIEKLVEVKTIKEDLDKGKNDPCWDGYVQLGTKTKDGKEVPNCVPIKEINTIKEMIDSIREEMINETKAELELSRMIDGLKIKDKELDTVIRTLVFSNTPRMIEQVMREHMPELN